MCPNVPRGCGMNSGKSALESGFCGAQGPGNENRDGAGGTCQKPIEAIPLSPVFICVLCCVQGLGM